MKKWRLDWWRQPIFWVGVLVAARLLIALQWAGGGYGFAFFYDQARDALMARQIANGDLTLFGPSASGTLDTVYHGALWYYFLAIWYGLSASPQLAQTAIIVLSSLNLVIIYQIARRMLRHDWAAVGVTGLMALGSLTLVYANWLSNPVLIYFFFPPFLYFGWRYFRTGRARDMAGVGLFLGLMIQAGIFTAFWGLLVVSLLILNYTRHRRLDWPAIGAGCLTGGLATSSMIIVELLLIWRGILTPQVVAQFNSAPAPGSPSEVLLVLIDNYGKLLSLSLWPQLIALSLVFWAVVAYYYRRRRPQDWGFYGLAVAVPLVFMMLVSRPGSLHLFAGLELVFYLILAKVCLIYRVKPAVIMGGLLIFAGLNLKQIRYLSETKQPYSQVQVQIGATLKDELALIDATYQLANGQPFTFSTLTRPYGINTTWHYLYWWYGRDKYGYTPVFIGPDQTGYPQAGLLEETSDYTKLYPTHVAILEPDVRQEQWLFSDFYEEQVRLFGTTPSGRLTLGTLELIYQ